MSRNTITALPGWTLDSLSAGAEPFWSLIAWRSARFSADLFGRLMEHSYFICLWFSLPLSIWLCGGWVGLLLQWRAICGVSRLPEQILPRKETLFAGIGCFAKKGERTADECAV